mgnify:CR=1 FL=1
MWIKILLLFFVFSFLYKTDSSLNQDLGRHIKLGEIITQIREVPKTNLFSYTNPDFPFINTHWLFGVLMYGASQTIGLQMVLVLKIIIFLVSVLLVIKIIPKENQALLLPVGFIILHVLRERLELRPEIFSFLFTASTYYILERYLKQPSKLIYLLPLVQLLWINTHIYFFVGLVLQAIFIITHRKLKLLWLIFGLSLLISLINPNGLNGLLFPLNVNTNYGYTIVENQTMFLLESINFRDPNFLFVKLSAGLIIISLALAFASRKFELKNILLASVGLGLAFLNVRSFPYLVFISLPAVLANFPNFKFKGVIKTLTLITIPFLILESYFYLNGDYYRFNDQPARVGLEFRESGKEALNFIITKDLPQPLFNNFDIGSYIIYRGFPKYTVFVDGRPEAYPAQFFTGIYIPAQSDYKNFKEVEKIYGFKTIIFSHTDQTPWGRTFLQAVIKDEAWKLVYIDDFMIVLTTQDMGLSTINLSQLDPNSYNFNTHLSYLRLGLFLLSTQNIESGRKFIEKTLQIFPDDPISNQLVGLPSKNLFFW